MATTTATEPTVPGRPTFQKMTVNGIHCHMGAGHATHTATMEFEFTKGICVEFEFQNGYMRCGETKKKQKKTKRWGWPRGTLVVHFPL